MFRALLFHLREAIHKCHLVYCVCFVSVGCARVEAAPEDEQVMLETCRGP
jgi:hypothetical protein